MFQCRFYEQEWPREGQIVVVKIKEIHDHGLLCSLLEYNEIEGYVAISELTRRRIKSKNQSEMKKGQLDLAKVVTVDEKRGFIDLNKEQLPREVVEKVTIRWNNSKKVRSIMKHVAQRIGTPVEEVYEKFLWPLARDMRKLDNSHAIMGLLFFHESPEAMAKKYHLRQKFVDALLPALRERLKPRQHKITALVQLQSARRQGDILMRRTLKAAVLVSTPCCPVEIHQKEPSIYEVKIHTLKPMEGSAIIWKILEKLRRVLTFGNRGVFRLLKAPIMLDPYLRKTIVKCQDPNIQFLESTPQKIAPDINKEGTQALSAVDQNKVLTKKETHSSSVNSKNGTIERAAKPALSTIGEADIDSAAPSPQCNDPISSPQQKVEQKKYIEAVPSTWSTKALDNSQANFSPTSQNKRLKRFRGLPNQREQPNSNKRAIHPQLQLSFDGHIWRRQRQKTSLHETDTSDCTEREANTSLTTTANSNEEIADCVICNRDNANRNEKYKSENAESQITGLGLLETYTPQFWKRAEGNFSSGDSVEHNQSLIPQRKYLSTCSLPNSRQPFSSMVDTFSSHRMDTVIQSPQMYKENSNPINYPKEFPPSSDVSNLLSPRISPQGLTPLQRGYLRELLLDIQAIDQEVIRSKFEFNVNDPDHSSFLLTSAGTK